MNELERYLKKPVEELEKLKKHNFILIWFFAFLGIMLLILFFVFFYKGNIPNSVFSLFVFVSISGMQLLLRQNYRYIEIVIELKKLKANQTPSGNPAPPSS